MVASKQGTYRLRVVGFAVAAAILVWQVTTRSFVAYLANARPETALSFRSTDSRALLNLAERGLSLNQTSESPQPPDPPVAKQELRESPEVVEPPGDRLRLWAELALKTVDTKFGEARTANKSSDTSEAPQAASPSPPTSDQIRQWTERSLINDPLNARALSILGQLAHSAGDEEGVAKFLRPAARRSIRESLAVYWLMRNSYESQAYATAVYFADALLRTRSQMTEHVMPTLVQIAESRNANGEIRKAVLGNPPWRSEFFSALASKASDPRAALELLLAVKETRAPPTAGELKSYVNALIGRKQYELAYYAWLQFLPPEQLNSTGLLFNGSFEVTPSGLPFDWVINPGAGVTIDIANRPDREGQRALLIEFGHGRVEFHGVQQLTMLAPGTYELKGKYKGEILGKRGMVWRVACADAPNTPIGESPMAIGASPRWKDVALSFTVPDLNCRAQQIRLEHDARMPSEQLITGTIWYDELRIARNSETERP